MGSAALYPSPEPVEGRATQALPWFDKLTTRVPNGFSDSVPVEAVGFREI
jgi:hypothetical protein